MQLKVLPDGDIRDATGVLLGNIRDRANLAAAQQAVRDANSYHEVWCRLAFSARSADDSHAVSLRVNAPGPEIGAEPLGRNRSIAIARKRANLVKMLPCILRLFQALDALCFGF